jgi:hypothetical protein
MAEGTQADQLAAQAAETVRRLIAEAETRAAEILSEAAAEAARVRQTAEADAAQARERAEADARAQIEAAKRALDELGGTLAAAASAAIPGAESTPAQRERQPDPESSSAEPEPEPEAPADAPAAGNGDEAAVRLVAMKLAVEGKDPAAIEAELIERFGPGDRTDLLKDVLSRVAR